jgi:hypothetical protein
MAKKKNYVVGDDMSLYQLKTDGSKELCKGEQVFLTSCSLVDGRNIIVAGIRSTIKQEGYVGELTSNGKIVIEPKRQKLTGFKMGFAICCPDDPFNIDEGVKIALRRAKYAKREIVANSYSMLGNDRCFVLVNDEMEYIEKNLGKYLNLFKK